MSTYYITGQECGEEYDVEVILYDDTTDRWETESGYEIDDEDIDNIGRDIIDDFVNSGSTYAYIRCDYLELDYELVRK